MPPRERANVTNVESATQLLHYAVIGQLELMYSQRRHNRKDVAGFLEWPAASLSRFVADPVATGRGGKLRRFDAAISALAPDLARCGGVAALAVRLRQVDGRDALMMQTPPGWTLEVMEREPVTTLDVLQQASTLLGLFQGAPPAARQIADRYDQKLRQLVDRLIFIGAAPPTAHNVDALILLGSLAGYAFDVLEGPLRRALTDSPMGFRAWRAITKVVVVNAGSAQVHDWVKLQLLAAEGLREKSIFPARSLDLETALAAPPDWSPPEDDWLGRVLQDRALNDDATVRERGTAAHGLWQRAVEQGTTQQVQQKLLDLCEALRKEAEAGDVAHGLTWVAATLEGCINSRSSICNTWPETDDPCRALVLEMSKRMKTTDEDPNYGVSAFCIDATRFLFEHALLQNAGVHRRQAIDALLAGGWTAPVVRLLIDVLEDPRCEAWLRCRALFAISFLQDRGPSVQYALREACTRATRVVLEDSKPTRGMVSELHATYFALGDSFGAPNAGDGALAVRDYLDPLIVEFVQASFQRTELHRAIRAAAYFVAATAHASAGPSQAILEQLSTHPDDMTSRLAVWALNRLAGTDGFLPLASAI